MKFSRDTLQQIREKTDMVELVNGYTHLERRGNRWWGLSPFKPEKTASFSVKPEDGFYYCFATNQGGDIFRFISEMEGLSFPEAVEYLAERAGVTVESGGGPSPEDQERKALLELYQRVSGSFHYLLTSDSRGSTAFRYAQDRGITETSIETFRLGYAPDNGRWLYQFLKGKAYSDDFLRRSGLFSAKGNGFTLFRNRLMFPIGDERDRIIAFGGRALSNEERAKYINSPETAIYGKKRTLYGLNTALAMMRQTRRAYLGEGYLDVIAMHQSGLQNTVAPLGTAFTEEQAKLLKRWVDEVVLVFDADTAGLNASFKAAITAEQAGLGCYAVQVPSGKDPADLYQEHGEQAVQDMVAAPEPIFDFMVNALSDTLNSDNGTNRELLLQRVFPYISIINSEVRRERAIDTLSDVFGVSAGAVQSDFERWRRGEQPQRVEQKSVDQKHYTTGRDVALMLATAQDGGLFAYLRSRVGVDQLQDRLGRHLFLLMEDAYRHDEPLPRGLIDRLTDESVRNDVLERLTSGEFAGWRQQDVDRAVNLIQIRALEAEAHQVEVELRRLSGPDERTVRELLEKKMAIDQELGNLKVRADD